MNIITLQCTRYSGSKVHGF